MTTRGVAIWLVNFLHKWPYSKTKVSLGSGVFLRWQRQQDQNSLEDVGKQVRLNKSVSKKRSWCRQFPENYVHEWHSNDCFVEKLQRRRRKTTGRVAKTEEISNKYCIKGAFCLPSPMASSTFQNLTKLMVIQVCIIIIPISLLPFVCRRQKNTKLLGSTRHGNTRQLPPRARLLLLSCRSSKSSIDRAPSLL